MLLYVGFDFLQDLFLDKVDGVVANHLFVVGVLQPKRFDAQQFDVFLGSNVTLGVKQYRQLMVELSDFVDGTCSVAVLDVLLSYAVGLLEAINA